MATRMHRPRSARLSASESACRPGGERPEHEERRVGAERDEDAVAEIDDVHQAEDEGQARGHEEDHHAHGEARRR